MIESRGGRVIRHEWMGHIKTKQLALQSATRPWVLCIDSDESVQSDLAASIRVALDPARDDPAIGGFAVNRKVYYRGRALNYAWQPEWRCRVVRNGGASWGGIDPHDVLSVSRGREARLSGVLRHDSFTTFGEQLAKQVRYAEIQARGMLSEGKRGNVASLLVSPGASFLKQLVLKRAFMDGWPGWLAAGCTGAQSLMKHITLIELERGEGRQSGFGNRES
ncbi:MAG: glycosyltransferase family 2 protein, partial [Phycisphaerales bacterium]|nr:glycosyltransferase family 2 protein [Phycisphaerales bacterium]